MVRVETEDDPNLAMTEKQLAHRVKIESIQKNFIIGFNRWSEVI